MKRNRASGFTLLEVMVAVAILAVGLAAVSGGIGMTVRSTALAAGYERARRVADNQLALFVATRPTRPDKKEGSAEGVRWRLQTEQDPEQEGLLRVIIEARFYAAGGERVLILETREVMRTLPKTSKAKEESS
jgi:general secretion pathway protein I